MSPKIVIIGSGFAGLQSALAAKGLITNHAQRQGTPPADIQVVLISPEPRLVLRPRLYEPNPQAMSSSLDKLFRDTGIEYLQGYVTGISPAEHTLAIGVGNGRSVSTTYDRLILAAGSSLNLPNIPGLVDHAFNVDQLEDAARLEAHLQVLAHRPDTRARNSVIICGGGFTGIEVATELPGRLDAILGQDADVRITIVERDAEIGPELGAGPRPVILQALQDLDIDLRLGDAVSRIDASGVVTSSGERLEASTVIWTGGMTATALTKQIPGAKDRFGRLITDGYLRVPTARDIFATGDAAHAVTDKEGHAALMSCQHAMVLGRFSGYNAAADLLGLPLKTYTQEDYGTCLALGDFGAVVTDGWDRKITTSGMMAGMIKQFINAVVIYPPATADEAYQISHPDFQLPSSKDGITGLLRNQNKGVLFLYIHRFLSLKLFGTGVLGRVYGPSKGWSRLYVFARNCAAAALMAKGAVSLYSRLWI